MLAAMLKVIRLFSGRGLRLKIPLERQESLE